MGVGDLHTHRVFFKKERLLRNLYKKKIEKRVASPPTKLWVDSFKGGGIFLISVTPITSFTLS